MWLQKWEAVKPDRRLRGRRPPPKRVCSCTGRHGSPSTCTCCCAHKTGLYSSRPHHSCLWDTHLRCSNSTTNYPGYFQASLVQTRGSCAYRKQHKTKTPRASVLRGSGGRRVSSGIFVSPPQESGGYHGAFVGVVHFWDPRPRREKGGTPEGGGAEVSARL